MGIDPEAIANSLKAYTPALSSIPSERVRIRAAVSLVLRAAGDDSELLLIRRAEAQGDRWSGDIALPGGRISSPAEPARDAAERETREEVGLDLGAARFLGQLDDVTGKTEAVLVSAFVYVAPAAAELTLNHEVDDARWLALDEISSPERQVMRRFDYLDHKVELPAVRVFDDDAPVLWGLTYRFLESFMNVIGRPLPVMPWRNQL